MKPLLPRHLLLAGAVGLSALPGTPLLAQAAGRIIDHAGDTVTLRAPARRVVSLLPPATELLFAIGAGDRVVGRSRWCTEPHGASAVPDVGDFLPPAIEPIVALRPDLVVLYQAGTNSGVAARLRALGIPTLQLRIDRLAELRRAALLLGEATGRLPAADSVVRALDRALRSASLAPPRRPPTVLLVAWSDPPVAIGRGAVQSELVDRAGGRNVLHDVAAASSPVSLEAIVARNPDIVVLPTGTAGAALTSPAWQVVPAVREGRVLTIDHSAFTWPSVRAPEVIALLSERLRAAVAVGTNRPASAQEPGDTTRLPELVVTATRLPEARDEVPATVTVLQGEELRSRGVRFVLDALREVPGVQVAQSGSFGGSASLFLRGGESNYVKVLVDGVPVNQPGGAYNLAYLSTDNVDRVEIVRGPASVLYGSDAVTGVIQVFTRRPDGPMSVTAAAEGGTYGTLRWNLGAGGGSGRFGWSAGVARHTTDGIYDFNNAFRNTVASASLRATPNERSDATVSLRYDDGVSHFPTNSTGAPVDHNQFNTDETLTIGLDAGHRFADWIEARAILGLTNVSTGAENRPDPSPGPSDFLTSLAEVHRRTVDLRAIARPAPGASVMAGVGFDRQSEHNTSRSDGPFGPFEPPPFDARRNNWGYYAQGSIDPVEPLTVTAGVRLDDNERFGEFVTFRVGAVGRVTPETRLRASVGTAFKEPSFFENFATGFVVGNRNLDPERGRTWEIGAERDLLDRRVTLTAAYFNQRFRDLIQYTPVPAGPGGPNYVNVGDARAFGVEVGATAAPTEGLTVGAAYTRLVTRVVDPGAESGDASEFVEGAALLRRPGHSGSVQVVYDWRGRARLGLVTTLVGRRDDLRFAEFPEPTRRVTLPAYATVDLSAEVPVLGAAERRPAVRLVARVANLLDEEYEQVAGYRAPGRTLTVGAAVAAP